MFVFDVRPLAVIAAVPPSAWKSTWTIGAARICAAVTLATPQFCVICVKALSGTV